MDGKVYKINIGDKTLVSENQINTDDNWFKLREGVFKFRKFSFKVHKKDLNTYNNLSLSKKVELKNMIGYYG